MPSRFLATLGIGLLLCSVPAMAQVPGPGMAAPFPALSLRAAETRLDNVSAALSGADHATAAAREAAAAVATLRRPVITASAQYLEYQKTLSVDLGDAGQNALDRTQAALGDLSGSVAPPFQAIAAEIAGRLSQALPGLFAAFPDTVSFSYRDSVFRPTVQAVMPLYTGGAIPAVQRGAAARVAMAEARGAQARDLARLNLIRVYFGQLAAQSLETSARETRDALARLYDDARKLEGAGVTPRARTLEAQVARDSAERVYQRALLSYRTACDELAQTLDLAGAVPTTPLFVQSRPLPPAGAFLGREGTAPQAREANAARDVARAGVDLARSRYRPQAFAFGEYNLNRNNALPIEPDWIVGAGVRITLLSNIDRGHSLAAARELQAVAADAGREARKGATLRAWDLVEAARRSFLLLDSSMTAARENLRVQQVSFREGETPLTAVIAAEAALATARTQRIATAYEYDLALAGLLAASGRLDDFDDHLVRADIRIAPEAPPSTLPVPLP